MASLLLAAPAGASAATPLIIDTDIWSNADDVAALATAFALQVQGRDQVIAITVNTRSGRPVATNSWKCAAAIAQFYDGPSGVPIGADMPDNGPQAGSPDFITPCAALASSSTPAPGTAVDVLRQALVNSGGGVTIAEIGYQENLQALLSSGPDSISPLTGHDLIVQDVSKLVVMGGGYPGPYNAENNLAGNPSAAADVAANWPTPIVWSGIEVNVNVGHTIDSVQPANSPVRVAYDAYRSSPDIQVFDPAAVYHAVLPNDAALSESAAGQNVVSSSNGANTFTTGTGNQHYAKLNNGTLASSLEKLFAVLPSGVQGPPPVPVDVTPPSISGTAIQGQTLTETHGSWSNGPTSYTYQWEICDNAGNSCAAIAGATGQTHVLSAADVGATVRVVETASNGTGAGGATASMPTALVAPAGGGGPSSPPAGLSLPTISGAAAEGQTLTESHGSWSNGPTGYSYQWQECDSVGNNCFALGGATGPTRVLTALDVGHTLRVAETASNAAGVGTPVVSAPTPVVSAVTQLVVPPAAAGGTPAAGVQPVPASSTGPSISGSAVQGHRLTESHGSWSSSPSGYSYQWERCNSAGRSCHALPGSTGQSYALGAGDVGSTIRVVEIARNASGGSRPATSNATSTVKVNVIAAHISSTHHTAKFHFGAIGNSSRLECGLARKQTRKGAKTPSPTYSRCGPRKTFNGLRAGSYVLWVRLLGRGGTGIAAPTYRFRIS